MKAPPIGPIGDTLDGPLKGHTSELCGVMGYFHARKGLS